MKLIMLTFGLTCALTLAQAADKAPAGSHGGISTPVPGQAGNFSGKVLETTNTAGYTYIRVDTGGRKVWVAAPSFEVKVGNSVTVGDAMPMSNYHSKSMNRDFDVVYFTGGVTVHGAAGAGAGAGAGHPPTALPKNHPPIGGAAASSKMDFSGIHKAEGGKTIAEIYAEQGKLQGQQVKLRGKVVKYNGNILGKNWLHLRDGTGAEGSNDLVVTTSSEVKPGATVLVSGNVALNKDFGFGYKYPVMIENAKVTVE